MKKLLGIFFLVVAVVCPACKTSSIHIHSLILRDRIAVLDQVQLKKALYAAFSVTGGAENIDRLRVKGSLYQDGNVIARAQTTLVREKSGNLLFDLPAQIAEGNYDIQLEAADDQRTFMVSGSRSIPRSELKKYNDSESINSPIVYREVPLFPEEHTKNQTRNRDMDGGYIIFSHSPLLYEHPETRPTAADIVRKISVRAARNTFLPLSISLYSIRDLGTVKLEIGDLKGPAGTIAKEKIKIGVVDSVQDSTGMPQGEFRRVPALIRSENRAVVKKDGHCRFWLTAKIDHFVQQGIYQGTLTVLPQYGQKKTIPLQITVLPLVLEDVPDKDYFMLMTYEFTELVFPWNKQEKNALQRSTRSILKSYKEHGMTMLSIHSPFVAVTRDDGTLVLDDIFAALLAARDAGFKKPIIWYMGHLIQTAKPKHPGNIKDFDQKVHEERLRHLVRTVADFAKENSCPPVIFLPIDEPDDSQQDFQNRRYAATSALLRNIKESGGKTMLTAIRYDQFKPVDYLCSAEMREEEMQAAHQNGSRYWIYNNKVTTQCDNPAYARYVYGYYTWAKNIDGMSSWTFQNTQNASGLPEKADTPGYDLYLAYPAPDGPLPTLKWEAIREGINDHKLLYQLMKRVSALKRKGIDTSRYEDFFSRIRAKSGEPACRRQDEKSEWSPDFFEQTRNELLDLILMADEGDRPQVQAVN